MPKKQITVGYDEIFNFAEKKFGMGWNTCCDVFYKGHETLQSPETHNKNIHLDESEEELEYIKEHRNSKYYNENVEKTYEVLIAYMKENKLKEMLVLNE